MIQQHMVVNSPIVGGLVVLEHGHFSLATIITPLGEHQQSWTHWWLIPWWFVWCHN